MKQKYWYSNEMRKSPRPTIEGNTTVYKIKYKWLTILILLLTIFICSL